MYIYACLSYYPIFGLFKPLELVGEDPYQDPNSASNLKRVIRIGSGSRTPGIKDDSAARNAV